MRWNQCRCGCVCVGWVVIRYQSVGFWSRLKSMRQDQNKNEQKNQYCGEIKYKFKPMYVSYLVKLRKTLLKILIELGVSKIKHILKTTFSVSKWQQFLIPFLNVQMIIRFTCHIHATTGAVLWWVSLTRRLAFTHHLFHENQFTYEVLIHSYNDLRKHFREKVSSNHSMNPRPDSPPFFYVYLWSAAANNNE